MPSWPDDDAAALVNGLMIGLMIELVIELMVETRCRGAGTWQR
jgi:hypothetical protein